MHFPVNRFSIIVRRPPCTARFVLSYADITYFISASVAVDRRFNAASKKENKTEGMSIHFLIKYFLKRTPSPLAHYTDEKNQPLKLLFDTAAVDLVLQLDLWVRKCSNFISMIISNTLFQNLCSWEAYLEPCQFSMTELLFELWAKSCLFLQKISII